MKYIKAGCNGARPCGDREFNRFGNYFVYGKHKDHKNFQAMVLVGGKGWQRTGISTANRFITERDARIVSNALSIAAGDDWTFEVRESCMRSSK